jgi:hypothetical protein
MIRLVALAVGSRTEQRTAEYSLFQDFYFDLTGRFFGRRLG